MGRNLEVVEPNVFPDLLDGIGTRRLGGTAEEVAELRRDRNHLLCSDAGTTWRRRRRLLRFRV